MGHRSDILNVLKGGVPGHIPYAPRFDIWFNAHQYRGTLPDAYKNCQAALDVSRILDTGGSLVVPDFIRPDSEMQMIDRGLSLYTLPQVPFSYELRNVERSAEKDGARTTVKYRTPKGTVTVAFDYSEEMKQAGSTISWISKHAISGEEDFEPLIYLFDHIELSPSYDRLGVMIDDVGEDALVVGTASIPASPMQHIMRDLMPMTDFYFAMIDHKGRLEALTKAIGSYFEQLMPISAKSPADVLLFGANFDEVITYPPFFEEHILPWIRRFSGMAHGNGKYTLLHADGENRSLFELYRQSGVDILEAVATAPMTKSDIHELLGLRGDMTIWGGIPSVVLMPEWPESDFLKFMETTLSAVNGQEKFILGISDTTPPDADFERLLQIRDMIR